MTLIFYRFPSVLLVIAAATAARILYIKTGLVELSYDEAQYWTWSKTPDLGYFSKPPMVAWLIALATTQCGDGIVCIKSIASVMHGLTALLVYGIGRQCYDARTGFWAALTYITLPAVTVSAVFTSADTPLALFWALALFAFIRASETINAAWWLVAGIAAGLGMLSKYTMIAFLPCALLCLYSTKHGRQTMKNPALWIGILAAFLIFFPNLLWNAAHDFISFRHTGDNVLSLGVAFLPKEGFRFIAGQFAVFGPVLLLALLWIALRMRRFPAHEDRLLLWFSLPLLAAGVCISFVSGAQVHWAAPAYIAATVLVTSSLLRLRYGKALLALSLLIHLAAAAGFYRYDELSAIVGKTIDPYSRLRPWNMAAAPLAETLHAYPEALALSDERKAVAALMYQLRAADGTPYPVMKWHTEEAVRDHYDLTTSLAGLEGGNFVLLTRDPVPEKILPYFFGHRKLRELSYGRRRFYIYYLEHFRGYE